MNDWRIEEYVKKHKIVDKKYIETLKRLIDYKYHYEELEEMRSKIEDVEVVEEMEEEGELMSIGTLEQMNEIHIEDLEGEDNFGDE